MRFGILAVLLLMSLFLVERAPAQPLRPALLGDDGYNESWALSAAGAGVYVQIVFGVANLGPGSGRATCRVLVLRGTQKWRHQLIASSGDWKHVTEPEPRLELPGCGIRGGASTTFTIDVEEGRATITLPAVTAVEERLVIKAVKGDPKYRESLLLENAPAEATFVVGGTEKQVTLTASLLHTLSRVAPDEIAPQWIRVRATDGSPFSALMLVGGANTEGYVFERGRPVMKILGAARRAAPLGKTPLHVGEGETSSTLIAKTELAQYEPLRELGFIGRVLGAIVGDPLVTVHDGLWSAAGTDRRVFFETITFR